MQRSVRPMPQATCCKKEVNRTFSVAGGEQRADDNLHGIRCRGKDSDKKLRGLQWHQSPYDVRWVGAASWSSGKRCRRPRSAGLRHILRKLGSFDMALVRCGISVFLLALVCLLGVHLSRSRRCVRSMLL